jgi:regulator of replication initiation timing
MQDLNIRLDELEGKIRQLIQKLENLNKQNKQLLEENLDLKNQLSEQLSKPAVVIPAPVDTEKKAVNEARMIKLRSEIDTYVKELDKCIEMVKSI